MKLCEAIRKKREVQYATQAEAARKMREIGKAHSYWNKIETGRRSVYVSDLYAMIYLLGEMEVSELLNEVLLIPENITDKIIELAAADSDQLGTWIAKICRDKRTELKKSGEWTAIKDAACLGPYLNESNISRICIGSYVPNLAALPHILRDLKVIS